MKVKSLWAALFAIIVLIISCNTRNNSLDSDVYVWEVLNKRWDTAAEKEFSIWIEKLGTARAERKCTKLGECLRNKTANSLYTQADESIDVFADCADVPMVLRSYFAYKTKRPFRWVSKISGSQYTSGNTPKGYTDQSSIGNIKSLFKTISSSVHSGSYRMAPSVEGNDTYPIDINKISVRPGTVFYDPNGHVLLVYKVEANGLVKLIDGHPDNSLTVQTFGDKFARGGASQGGGFRNFRPYEVNSEGQFIALKNTEIKDFGTSQYSKTFAEGSYHKWVRAQLASDGGKINPESEITDLLNQLCIDIVDRIEAVNSGVKNGLHEKTHPSSLPSNIYGTDGEWESFSTPSRDARLKASFREIHTFIKESVTLLQSKDPRFIYQKDKQSLISLYKSLWNNANAQCKLSYLNSNKKDITFTLNTVMDRLFDLSFDPYHCPELRWGATFARNGKPSHPEYASCPKNENKEKWYSDEYRLRNAIDRMYGAQTPLDYGPETSPEIHIPKLLESIINL